MTSEPIKTALKERDVPFEERANGDVFFVRPQDGVGMYVRSLDDVSYDWSVGAGPDDPLMDYRAPEHHDLRQTVQRIETFLAQIVPGAIMIDTLEIARRSMELGMEREAAERLARGAADYASQMNDAGMDAHEIRNRFGEIHEQLKRERLSGGGGQHVKGDVA